jgi:hypothetical protein
MIHIARIKEIDMLSIREINPTDKALDEAERCRTEARKAVEQNPERHAALKGQPSGWCVVTQKGLWSRTYHNGYGAVQLKDCLDRGHKVLLTVGIVARPDSPLKADTHLAHIRVTDRGRLSDYKLDLISTRAKLHATHALIG